MQRIDAFYLYQFGYKLHQLNELRAELFTADGQAITKRFAFHALRDAELALGQFLYSSVFELKVSLPSGEALLVSIQGLKQLCENCPDDDEKLKWSELSPVTNALRDFESVLKAELGKTGTFLVGSKNAMDILTLIEAGEQAFPADLAEKVPAAIRDVQHAMSCIAFELPTAAAFHLHRANETVLKKYWEIASVGQPLKPNSTMGQIVKQMEDNDFGRKEIRSSLRDLIALHRNPTIHPEQSLQDVEEAINLYGAVRSIVGFMLREIPETVSSH